MNRNRRWAKAGGMRAIGRLLSVAIIFVVWLLACFAYGFSQVAFPMVARYGFTVPNDRPPEQPTKPEVCAGCGKRNPPYLSFTQAELEASTFFPALAAQMADKPSCAACWKRANELAMNQPA